MLALKIQKEINETELFTIILGELIKMKQNLSRGSIPR